MSSELTVQFWHGMADNQCDVFHVKQSHALMGVTHIFCERTWLALLLCFLQGLGNLLTLPGCQISTLGHTPLVSHVNIQGTSWCLYETHQVVNSLQCKSIHVSIILYAKINNIYIRWHFFVAWIKWVGWMAMELHMKKHFLTLTLNQTTILPLLFMNYSLSKTTILTMYFNFKYFL